MPVDRIQPAAYLLANLLHIVDRIDTLADGLHLAHQPCVEFFTAGQGLALLLALTYAHAQNYTSPSLKLTGVTLNHPDWLATESTKEVKGQLSSAWKSGSAVDWLVVAEELKTAQGVHGTASDRRADLRQIRRRASGHYVRYCAYRRPAPQAPPESGENFIVMAAPSS